MGVLLQEISNSSIVVGEGWGTWPHPLGMRKNVVLIFFRIWQMPGAVSFDEERQEHQESHPYPAPTNDKNSSSVNFHFCFSYLYRTFLLEKRFSAGSVRACYQSLKPALADPTEANTKGKVLWMCFRLMRGSLSLTDTYLIHILAVLIEISIL